MLSNVWLQLSDRLISVFYPLTRIVDQYVEPLLSVEEALAELPYRLEVGQVQLHVEDVKTPAPELDLPHSLLGFGHISTRNDDTGASHRQGHRCLLPNARVTTCKEARRVNKGSTTIGQQ